MVEESRRKVPFNTWEIKVLKGHTISIRHLYRVKDIDKGYRLEIARRSRKQALKSKSNMPRSLKANM